jgi:hypothetical protein
MWRWPLTRRSFADLANSALVVIADHAQGYDWLQTWWEDEFRQPSTGNPLWENVAYAEHFQCWLRRQLAKGSRYVVTKDGQLVSQDGPQEVRYIELKLTGNELADARIRKMALGLPLKG